MSTVASGIAVQYTASPPERMLPGGRQSSPAMLHGTGILIASCWLARCGVQIRWPTRATIWLNGSSGGRRPKRAVGSDKMSRLRPQMINSSGSLVGEV
jgi:hypothetical protein